MRLDGHERIVLEFSGGKDSLACLYLFEAHWERMIVLWVNTGAAFPETIDLMDRVRGMAPHFHEVKTDQASQVAEYGYPVDVLPLRNDRWIGWLLSQDRPRLQSFLQCCMANIMRPMGEAVKALGATLVIRGQKLSDNHKSPLRDGDVVDGIEYHFPIEVWTDDEVRAYLGDRLPAHYAHGNTSLDCWNCTAYLEENSWKLDYLKRHPLWREEVGSRLRLIRAEIGRDVAQLDRVMAGL